MGCDIYEHFEVYRKGLWERLQVLPVVPCWDDLTPEQEMAYWSLPLFLDRDYRLFSILANVRNPYGIQPMAFPRGLPDDLSPEVHADWDEACDSPSWFLLQELLAFDWNQPLRGISPEATQAAKWQEQGWKTYRDVIQGNRFIEQGLLELQKHVTDNKALRMVFWFYG